MTRKALILNGEVVDVVDQEFEVHPSLQWADCPDWVKPRDTFANGEFTEFQPDPEMMARIVRNIRNQRLQQCDWVVFAPQLTDEQKADLEVYRQALRDVPEQAGFPLNVDWPVAPA